MLTPGRATPLLLAAVLVASAWSLLFWARLPSRLPADGDYRALGKALAAARDPADAVIAAPDWAERARAVVPDLLDLDPRLLSIADLHGARTLWVVAVPDVPRSSAERDLRRLGSVGGLVEQDRRRFGALVLARFEVTAPPVAFDFRERLGEARVSIRGTAGEEPCPGAAGRFQCSRGPWNHVAAGWHEVDRHGRRCIWAHPVGTEPLVIEFPEATLGTRLSGGAGFADSRAALTRGKPGVALSVRVDGAEAFGVEVPPLDERWLWFDVEVPPGPHRVAFEVTAPDPGRRLFCFDAVSR